MRDPERKERPRRDPADPAGSGRGSWVIIGLVILALLVVVLVWILPSFTGQMDEPAVEITPENSTSPEGAALPGETDDGSMDTLPPNDPQNGGAE